MKAKIRWIPMVCGLLLADAFLLVPLFLFALFSYGGFMGGTKSDESFLAVTGGSFVVVLGLNAFIVLCAHKLRWLFVITILVLGVAATPCIGMLFRDIFTYSDASFLYVVFQCAGLLLWTIPMWLLLIGVDFKSDEAEDE